MVKKTHEDRIRLINRLERKFAAKVRMRNQIRRENLKNAFSAMRERRNARNNLYTDSVDGIMYHTQIRV